MTDQFLFLPIEEFIATSYGTRIKNIPIQTKQISKPRHIAWEHSIQLFYVLKWLIKP